MLDPDTSKTSAIVIDLRNEWNRGSCAPRGGGGRLEMRILQQGVTVTLARCVDSERDKRPPWDLPNHRFNYHG